LGGQWPECSFFWAYWQQLVWFLELEGWHAAGLRDSAGSKQRNYKSHDINTESI
jgi:hypothetical protein